MVGKVPQTHRIASDKDQMVQHSTQLNKKTDLGWGRNGDVGVLFLKIHSPGMTYVDHVFSFAENCTCRMYCSRNTYPKYEQYLSLLSPVARIVPYMPNVSNLSVWKK